MQKNKLMKRILIIIPILILLYSIGSNAQILVPKKDYIPEVRKSRYSFCISLVSGGYNSMVSYGIMRELPDSTKEIQYLSRATFMRQFAGAEKSKANSEKINFFETYQIATYIFDDLWKLKYNKNPYSAREEKGWANGKNQPSEAQFQMLSVFGITKIADYAYGDKLILLLQKLSDPIWVGEYQNK